MVDELIKLASRTWRDFPEFIEASDLDCLCVLLLMDPEMAHGDMTLSQYFENVLNVPRQFFPRDGSSGGAASPDGARRNSTMVQAFSAREVRDAIKKHLSWHSGLYPVFTGSSGSSLGAAGLAPGGGAVG